MSTSTFEQVIAKADDEHPRREQNPAGPSEIRPEDATPEEGVEAPEPEAPDPDHVVEEKRQSD
jgi:hypothetical protein